MVCSHSLFILIVHAMNVTVVDGGKVVGMESKWKIFNLEYFIYVSRRTVTFVFKLLGLITEIPKCAPNMVADGVSAPGEPKGRVSLFLPGRAQNDLQKV